MQCKTCKVKAKKSNKKNDDWNRKVIYINAVSKISNSSLEQKYSSCVVGEKEYEERKVEQARDE